MKMKERLEQLRLFLEEREAKRLHFARNKNCWNCLSPDIDYRIVTHELQCGCCGEIYTLDSGIVTGKQT